MNNDSMNHLKSAKRRVNCALIFLGLPLLPFLGMALLVLVVNHFNFVEVFFDFWISTHIAFPLLFMCFYLVPVISFFCHLKNCLHKRKRPSVKTVSFLRAFFMVALVAGCCLNVRLLYLYFPVGFNTFSLFVAFCILTALIGCIFAFSAFKAMRKRFKE